MGGGSRGCHGFRDQRKIDVTMSNHTQGTLLVPLLLREVLKPTRNSRCEIDREPFSFFAFGLVLIDLYCFALILVQHGVMIMQLLSQSGLTLRAQCVDSAQASHIHKLRFASSVAHHIFVLIKSPRAHGRHIGFTSEAILTA